MSYSATRAKMPAEDWNNFFDGPTDREIREAQKRADAKTCECLDVIQRIMAHVIHARTKHPEWIPNDDYVLSVAEMEWDEFCHALRWEGQKRAEEEALDLIAVLVRFLMGDAR